MTWRTMVHREAGNYGAVGAWVPQETLGDLTFPTQPEVGQYVEIRGEEYLVVQVAVGFIIVRPRVMKAT